MHHEKENVPSESCRGFLWLNEGIRQVTPGLDAKSVQPNGHRKECDSVTKWTDEEVEDKPWDLDDHERKISWQISMCGSLQRYNYSPVKFCPLEIPVTTLLPESKGNQMVEPKKKDKRTHSLFVDDLIVCPESY